MPADRDSLPAGRNAQHLDERSVRSVISAFLGLAADAPVRYEDGARTRFRVTRDANGNEIAEIVFGPDIYPGQGVDANSSMSMVAAAAHELVHWYRWTDRRDIDDDGLVEIDEALTSLEAVVRFAGKLSEHDSRLLVSDAMQRLLRYVQNARA